MPLRKKSSGAQMKLGEVAPVEPSGHRPDATSPVEAPRLLRYLPLMQADQWQVERFDLLTAEMHMQAESRSSEVGVQKSAWTAQMQLFHEFTQSRTKAWLLVRRLFGIAPLVPGPETHPDDLKSHTREEIVASGLAASKDEIIVELETLRILFSDQHPSDLAVGHHEDKPEELVLDDALLEKYGFSVAMFQVLTYNRPENCDAARAASENRAEQSWFTNQLRYEKWQKMLAHKMYGGIASDALMSQLYLRRVQHEMGALSPMHPRFKELSAQKSSFAKQYQDQLDELQKKFPELAISNESGAKGTLSDYVIGQRDYYSSNGGNNKLINAFCTAMELEWMLRAAVQRPASFRFGLSVSVVEAAKGIYDPNHRTKFKPSVLKMLDAGHRASVDLIRNLLNEPMVDLAVGVSPDEPDQFPDFAEHPTSNIQHPTSKEV